MDARIIKTTESFTFEEYDIGVKDFNISSIEIRSNYEERDGGHGNIDGGATFGVRTITIPFYFKAADMLDYPLLRDLLFSLVLENEPFYIQELRRPQMLEYDFADPGEPAKVKDGVENTLLPGKRYFVRPQNTFNVEQVLEYGEGELIFETVELPFGESWATTLDPRITDVEMWQVGQGLVADDCKYVHNTPSFQIYNAGDLTVDPRQSFLEITFVGQSDQLSIMNLTTSEEWKYDQHSTINDTIKITGVRSFKNGSSIFGNTNRKIISLAPGWNDLRVSNASNFELKFDFRFLYK